jgi:hypothetical protein
VAVVADSSNCPFEFPTWHSLSCSAFKANRVLMEAVRRKVVLARAMNSFGGEGGVDIQGEHKNTP